MMAFYVEDLKLGRNKKWGFKTHCNKQTKKHCSLLECWSRKTRPKKFASSEFLRKRADLATRP